MTQEDILRAEHEKWVNHDLTKVLIKRIKEQRELDIIFLATNFANMSFDASLFRVYSGHIKILDDLMKIISDRNKLIPVVKQEESKQFKPNLFI